MSTMTIDSHVFEDIHDEHERLELFMTEIERALAQPSLGHLRVIRVLMAELVPLLDEHFAHEEQGGYFTDLIELHPILAPKVEQLRQQHRDMLAIVQAINSRLRHADDSPRWFAAIHEDFAEFARRCEAHQHEENGMVQEVYLQDLGTGD